MDTAGFESALQAAYAAGHEAGSAEREKQGSQRLAPTCAHWLLGDEGKALVAQFNETQESARLGRCAVEWAMTVIEARRELLERIRAHLIAQNALEDSGFEMELAWVIDAMKPNDLKAHQAITSGDGIEPDSHRAG